MCIVLWLRTVQYVRCPDEVLFHILKLTVTVRKWKLSKNNVNWCKHLSQRKTAWLFVHPLLISLFEVGQTLRARPWRNKVRFACNAERNRPLDPNPIYLSQRSLVPEALNCQSSHWYIFSYPHQAIKMLRLENGVGIYLGVCVDRIKLLECTARCKHFAVNGRLILLPMY